MRNKSFCIFILTHGRANNVITYKSLSKYGYTGPVYIIIDNEDDTASEYKKIYKDKVIQFDKKAISKTFDEGDNFNDRRTIVYARNACFGIAEKLGYEYFMELDDDYFEFIYMQDESLKLSHKPIKNLDLVLDLYIDYYKKINAKSICFSQTGDFIGGEQNQFARIKKPYRKAMNTFLCSTKRKFNFIGRINEDVNTYTFRGSLGDLFFTLPFISINQKDTQSNDGGMSDIYIDKGTYYKSFYTVMFHPSSVKIALMGEKAKRLHHNISWNNTVPVILSEKHKK